MITRVSWTNEERAHNPKNSDMLLKLYPLQYIQVVHTIDIYWYFQLAGSSPQKCVWIISVLSGSLKRTWSVHKQRHGTLSPILGQINWTPWVSNLWWFSNFGGPKFDGRSYTIFKKSLQKWYSISASIFLYSSNLHASNGQLSFDIFSQVYPYGYFCL